MQKLCIGLEWHLTVLYYQSSARQSILYTFTFIPFLEQWEEDGGDSGEI